MSNYTGSVPDTAPRPTDWLSKAPCKADPDAMFPGSNTVDIENAKSFCYRCSAVDKCLQWALDTGEEHGVWGGLSEAERRQLRRRAVRPISIDEYAGTRPTRAPIVGRSLQQVWDDCTEPDGEHLMWIGAKTVSHETGSVTPNRLSFFLDRGRWPEGDVKRTCSVNRCVKPGHLADRKERAEETGLALAS